MNPSLKWRAPIVALAVAFSLVLVYPPFDPDGGGPKEGKLKLGLDLQGGMHLVLHVETETLPEEQRKDATERALEIIRNRIDQFGVSEPSIQRQGVNEIVVQLPGITDRERALNLIGRTALLEFKLASDQPVPAAAEAGKERELPPGTKIYKEEDGKEILLEDKTLLEGKSLVDATVQYSSDWGEPVVSIRFDGEGGKTFADITTNSVDKRLAILLDGVVQSAPVIREPILNGEAQISGSFSLRGASDLAIALRAGALPAPIRIEEERTVGPSLGKDSVEEGVRATIIAGILVFVFMAVYYLAGGIVADIALLLNILITGACLAYFKATLTVPGIAGIILTIGMAVDTNVLILERIREELRLGKSLPAAVSAGYRLSFGAIFDTHLTTLITALILFKLGTGPVRGFAVTLIIGLIGSFFTGIFMTRVVTDILIGWGAVKRFRMMSFLARTPTFNFIQVRTLFYVLSLVAVAGGLFYTATHIHERLGIDFTGGVLQEHRFEKPVEVEEVRNALKEVGLETATIQQFGTEHSVVIRVSGSAQEKIKEAIDAKFTANPHEMVRIESVGPIVGSELRKKSLWAAVLSLLAILVYLAFRFQFQYSFAAIVAVFHDAIVSLTAVVLTGREISIPVLAALLTIVGFSVNDTIVTFDRVRENLKKSGKAEYPEIVNKSINETLARTILTSLTVIMVVVALFVFGGPVINDFAFTMLVGLLCGTYSTIFVACPMVVDWPGRKSIRRR